MAMIYIPSVFWCFCRVTVDHQAEFDIDFRRSLQSVYGKMRSEIHAVNVIIPNEFLCEALDCISEALYWSHMMWRTLSALTHTVSISRGHDDIFRVGVPLRGETTGQRWLPLAKASDAGLWCFLWCVPKCTTEQTSHQWIPRTKPLTRSFYIFFDLRLNKRLSKQSWCCWLETLPGPLWRHCNAVYVSRMNNISIQID